MRIVIQRVSQASVEVEGEITGQISRGLLILLGIEDADEQEDINWLTNKIVNLRIFNDENGVMNKSILETERNILVISQFTLHASTKKGNRPSYIRASKPEFANKMYEQFKEKLGSVLGKPVQSGVFGVHMNVSLINDGPVTIIIDSKNRE